MTNVAVVIYNFCIVAGTAYLVALHDWSGWWFLLTIMLLMGTKNENSRTDD